jgi:hypothetical protein
VIKDYENIDTGMQNVVIEFLRRLRTESTLSTTKTNTGVKYKKEKWSLFGAILVDKSFYEVSMVFETQVDRIFFKREFAGANRNPVFGTLVKFEKSEYEKVICSLGSKRFSLYFKYLDPRMSAVQAKMVRQSFYKVYTLEQVGMILEKIKREFERFLITAEVIQSQGLEEVNLFVDEFLYKENEFRFGIINTNKEIDVRFTLSYDVRKRVQGTTIVRDLTGKFPEEKNQFSVVEKPLHIDTLLFGEKKFDFEVDYFRGQQRYYKKRQYLEDLSYLTENHFVKKPLFDYLSFTLKISIGKKFSTVSSEFFPISIDHDLGEEKEWMTIISPVVVPLEALQTSAKSPGDFLRMDFINGVKEDLL